MKSIRITKLNTSTYKDIEYWDDGQESLDSIIYKFDSNLDSNNTRLAVGKDLFLKWDTPIDTALHYNDSIQIYTFLVKFFIEYHDEKIEIEMDSRRSILILKSVIKRHFQIPIHSQLLSIDGELIVDNIEPLLYHNIKENSLVNVSRKVADADESKMKCISISYCGKPTEHSLYLDEVDTIYTIREKVFDEGINPEKYMIRLNDQMLDQVRQTLHGKTYADINWKSVHCIELYPKHVCAEPVEVLKQPKLFEWNTSVPEWQITKPGMCLTGQCTNKDCIAFNSTVIMNIPTPVIYKFGAKHNNSSCCPICNEFVEPKSAEFNNTEWRFVAIKKTKTGLDRYKSDWKFANHTDHQELTKTELANWDSLVIETKNRSSYLTAEYKCDLCLSLHEPILNKDGHLDYESCRHEYYASYLYTDLRIVDNFYEYNVANC